MQQCVNTPAGLRTGAVQDPKNINLVSDPKAFLGISDRFGFTKKNELFVGRVAMLGFAAELIGELAQGGKGPLGQLGACLLPPLLLPLCHPAALTSAYRVM